MSFLNFITMIGGIALFLYGMQVLGNGLQSVSGGRLEKILEKLTSNKWKGMLLGAGVTAIIQSSGATVVMVVGLVNSGIMDLNQAVGVILGANIGTTITAWILSMTGISSSNILLSMLKPANFSPIVALIGVFLLMFSKKDSRKYIGTIMVGFAVLMIGMTMMSDAFSPLADDPKFTSILTMFSNQPLLGLLAGLAVTAILQSSSASVGILQAISMSGTLTVASAIPVLMGENIGSALTALLGAVGSSRNAKRAAWIQMLYCLVKTTTFMILFYAVNAIVHFPFMSVITNPVMIAVIHSCFNIAAVLVFLPMSDILVKMVKRLIPVSAEEQEEIRRIPILDEHFLTAPSFALEQCRTAANEMAQYSKEALYIAMDMVDEFTEDGAKKVDRLEKTVDEYEDQLDSYLVKLSRQTLTTQDSHELSILLHCINDWERITDHALNIMQAAQQLHLKELTFSARAKEEMQIYGDAVRNIVNMALMVFTNNDLDLARDVEPLEEVIDGVDMEEKRRHIRRLRKGKCTIEAGFILTDITTDYERVADHCSNIAVALLQVNEDGFDTHEYLDRIRDNENPEFEASVHRYEEKYSLGVMKKDDDTALPAEKTSKTKKQEPETRPEKGLKPEKTPKTEKPEKVPKPEKSGAEKDKTDGKKGKKSKK